MDLPTEPDLEVRHGKDDAYDSMSGTIYDPGQHEICHGSVTNNLQMASGNPRAFWYRHKEVGSFGVCTWHLIAPSQYEHFRCNPLREYGPGLFNEIELFEYNPLHFPPPDKALLSPNWTMIVAILRGQGPTNDEVSAGIRARKRMDIQRRMDAQGEKVELQRVLRAKGKYDVARSLDATPYVPPSQMSDMERQQMKDIQTGFRNRVSVRPGGIA